ncbi:uncharacterized protein LOC126378379 [Pectinophora gossypiella]|uniref:uncharacterized protein LOC126378379 n=1 Tax=Pectinophora gossypiella TaxID=13191 RepID=UPI00214E2CA3|nr:uncharacterized protein LOC126378379 [Pectinophora gossypiella]
MCFNGYWSIEKCKEQNESDDHWELRRRFMERWRNHYPESKLMCLAKVFANMEWLGCRYPTEIMKEVAALSYDVLEDYRSACADKIKRTFVPAWDYPSEPSGNLETYEDWFESEEEAVAPLQEGENLQTAEKKRHRSGAEKRRYAFWVKLGYSKKEAAARCPRPLADFPEYKREDYPTEPSRNLETPCEDWSEAEGVITFTSGAITPDSWEDQGSQNSEKKKHRSGAAKRRYALWLRRGYTKEEAAARSLRPMADCPELKPKHAGEGSGLQPRAKKRPRDETSSLEEPHRKTARSETVGRPTPPKFTAVAESIKVGIVDDKGPMTEAQIGLVQDAIIDRIHKGTTVPQFLGSCVNPGWLSLICQNKETKEWLMTTIRSIELWDGASLRVVTNFPKPTIITCTVKDVRTDPKVLCSRLAIQNQDMEKDISRWRLLNAVVKKDRRILCFRIDDVSLKKLQKRGFKLCLNLSMVTFRHHSKAKMVEDSGPAEPDSATEASDGECFQQPSSTQTASTSTISRPSFHPQPGSSKVPFNIDEWNAKKWQDPTQSSVDYSQWRFLPRLPIESQDLTQTGNKYPVMQRSSKNPFEWNNPKVPQYRMSSSFTGCTQWKLGPPVQDHIQPNSQITERQPLRTFSAGSRGHFKTHGTRGRGASVRGRPVQLLD